MKLKTILILLIVPFVPLIGNACSRIIHASAGEDAGIVASCLFAIIVLCVLAFWDLMDEKC